MKYAIVNGEKLIASKGAIGKCIYCGAEMVARCGEVKTHHWAHKTKRICDVWWENETEWHRAWKDNFPKEYQEVVHFAEDGEKHIADVKIDGLVFEFQHSRIDPVERDIRTSFYGDIVWIVDGTRRKFDKHQFYRALQPGTDQTLPPMVRELRYIEECRLCQEWKNTNAAVFLDFCNDDVWLILPKTTQRAFYVLQYPKFDFKMILQQNCFIDWYRSVVQPIVAKLGEREAAIMASIRKRNSQVLAARLTPRVKRRRRL
jgi:competence protein CoiA